MDGTWTLFFSESLVTQATMSSVGTHLHPFKNDPPTEGCLSPGKIPRGCPMGFFQAYPPG